jgi:glutamyl-tRNA reductase
MMKQIFAADMNVENAPAPIREKFTKTDAMFKLLLQRLGLKVEEMFIFSTGNRFSLYIVHDTIEPLIDFFTQTEAKGYAQFCFNTEESITNLFATSSGLLSPVKGDHQIFSQLKQSYQLAVKCGAIGLVLDNLVREAIHVGKKVRTQTAIDKYCTSVVDAGFSLLYDRLNEVHNKKFLIIGGGKVSRLALEYLQGEGVKDVTIASHSSEQRLLLAAKYGYETVPLEKIIDQFYIADVIIGGTNHDAGVDSKIISEMYIRYLMNCDVQKSRIILDFGMPRNFDNSLREYPFVELYNLDDLKLLHNSPLDAFGGLEAAWRIVTTEAQEFHLVLQQLEVSPVLAAYWTRLVEVKKNVTDHLFPKLENPTIQDIESIRKHAHKISKKISQEPLKSIRLMANNLQAENPEEVVKNLSNFGKVRLNLSKN